MENQTAQNPASEPTLTPVQVSEPKTKFPVMYLVLSLFILALLASTVFLYYQNTQLKNILASYQTQPTVSPTPTTTDSTANWKTYTEILEKVSFKYPESWKLLEGEGGEYIVSSDNKTTLMTTGGLRLSTSDKDLHNYLEKQTSYGNQNLKYLFEKPIEVDGAKGWYAHIKIASLNQEDIIFFLEDKNFTDRYTGLWLADTSDQYQDIFDQILSTFKFTN